MDKVRSFKTNHTSKNHLVDHMIPYVMRVVNVRSFLK